MLSLQKVPGTSQHFFIAILVQRFLLCQDPNLTVHPWDEVEKVYSKTVQLSCAAMLSFCICHLVEPVSRQICAALKAEGGAAYRYKSDTPNKQAT